MTTIVPARAAAAATLATLAHDGVTFDPVTLSEPTWGYAVATVGREEIYELADDPRVSAVELTAILEDYIRRHHSVLASSRYYLGTWLHDGRIYLDVSEVIRGDLPAAIATGVARQQLAIFDLLRKEEISLLDYTPAAIAEREHAEPA